MLRESARPFEPYIGSLAEVLLRPHRKPVLVYLRNLKASHSVLQVIDPKTTKDLSFGGTARLLGLYEVTANKHMRGEKGMESSVNTNQEIWRSHLYWKNAKNYTRRKKVIKFFAAGRQELGSRQFNLILRRPSA